MDYVFGMDMSLPEIKNEQVRNLYYQALDDLDADFIFTTFTEDDQDYQMTQERAEQIISEVPDGEYRLQPTFIKINNGWTIEKARNPLRDNTRKRLFTLTKDTRPGALVGIDSMFYDVAYPTTVVIYAAYKIQEPDASKLKPMRHPGNCVAKLIREFFTDAARGGKLTDQRRDAIRTWEFNTKKSGGTIENIKKLETAIGRRIKVKDILSNDIYPGTQKYAGKGQPIVIYQHNGHAWRECKFPRLKNTVTFDVNPIWDLAEESSIWLLDDDCEQFITQDGTLYRRLTMQNKIKEACALIGADFEEEVFSSRSLNFMAARKRNGWKPTPKKLEISKACVEHGHGGLWNMEYDYKEYVSLDMKHCYPASFKGLGDCAPYYDAYGHPHGQFFHVALNGSYDLKMNGFVKLTTWKLKPGLHPIIYAWYGNHMKQKHWMPVPLLRFFVDEGMLEYTAHEAILCESAKTQWLPEDNHESRIVIGKFTQGAKEGDLHLQRRLVTDKEELNFLIRRAHEQGILVRTEDHIDFHILCYYHETKQQYYHLRASMLAYAHINLLKMLLRFEKEDIPRVATDSLYVKPDALEKVKEFYTEDELAESGQWRIKDEKIRSWRERVRYDGSDTSGSIDPTVELLPSVQDPITYHKFSYLHGPGGSGKTTRVLKIFPHVKVLTPTHRLEREIGGQAQTWHSFFRFNGQKWVPEAIKEVPPIILWDEVCTVPLEILKELVDFLDGKAQVIFAGDPHQPPPIGGTMPHEWLLEKCYSEEVLTDYRSKDHVRKLKKKLRGLTDQHQCKVMRKALEATSYEDFKEQWHPTDLVLSSRRAMQSRIQKDLLQVHQERFPDHPVPVVYRPHDTRLQKKTVRVPGTDVTIENAVTHDKAWIPMSAVKTCMAHVDWRLGYCMTVHSCQGLTVKEKLWIIDQRLCWSNLIYTAVSRVEKQEQLRRAWGPQLRYDNTPIEVAKENILKKLRRYQHHDEQKKMEFDLCVDDIYQKDARCAKCNIPLLWSFEPNDDQQFSVDRLDNRKGHQRGNIRLTCLDCNRTRGAALL